jgi:predicted CDP-diglyceride synthetase/phosphatidate cytidylyltransferase
VVETFSRQDFCYIQFPNFDLWFMALGQLALPIVVNNLDIVFMVSAEIVLVSSKEGRLDGVSLVHRGFLLTIRILRCVNNILQCLVAVAEALYA